MTKANLHLVPEHYRRKQTTANAERFVTDELETYEAKVLGAEERSPALEAELFEELVAEVVAQCHESLGATARGLWRRSTSSPGSRRSPSERAYVRPRVAQRAVPCESWKGATRSSRSWRGDPGFVANDCTLDPENQQILILTGPNMAGKVDLPAPGRADHPAGADG